MQGCNVKPINPSQWMREQSQGFLSREFKPDAGFPCCTLCTDPATVDFNQLFDDGQADACSARLAGARRVSSKEPFKDERDILFIDALAAVGKFNSDAFFNESRGNFHPATGRCVFPAIFDQVTNGLQQLVAVSLTPATVRPGWL